MGDTFLDVLSAKDISLGGVAVAVPHGFRDCNILDEVDLVLKLPGRAAFLAKGVIRHVNAELALFGVEFTHVGDADRLKIEQYVNELVARGRGI